jgi:hypothetical protein
MQGIDSALAECPDLARYHCVSYRDTAAFAPQATAVQISAAKPATTQ